MLCRLYDSSHFLPKYANQPCPPSLSEPKAKSRAPSASTHKVATPTEAAAAPEAANGAISKPSRESLHAPKALKDSHARPSTTTRVTKDTTPRDGRDSGGKESKDSSARDGRDRGRDASTRGVKEHADKAPSARDGRDTGRASGKAADDQQQQEQKLRAAALKATANGTNGDAAKGRSPARRDEALNGVKASAVNGTAAATGVKRRAPDLDATEVR